MSEPLTDGAYVASALMAANISCDSGEDVDRFLAELGRRGYEVAERAARPAPPETAWLVERGQPERQTPTVWWTGAGWTEDANLATRYGTREVAEEVIRRQFTPPASRGGPSARVVEHRWLAARPAPPERDALDGIDDYITETQLEAELLDRLRRIRAARPASPDMERLRPLFREYEQALIGLDVGWRESPDLYPGGIEGQRARRDAARAAIRDALATPADDE